MATHLLQADAVVLEDEVAAGAMVAIDGDTIQRVGHQDPGALPVRRVAGTLLPGLIDLQVNGAGGHSVDEPTTHALDAIATSVHAGGATAFLPTLITAPFPDLLDRLAKLADWIDAYEGSGARPLGIHLEGPFLQNPGTHNPDLFLAPTGNHIRALLDAAHGKLRLVTLAPGVDGAAAATEQLCAADVAVALGHGQGEAGIADCVAAGATLATHLYNGMGPTHHRDPGMIGRILDEPRLRCSMIVDGIHVHETYVRRTYDTLGDDRLLLVTDGTAASGMPDGTYRLAGIEITRKDGAVRNPDGGLAGSCLTMAEGARNFLRMVPGTDALSLARIGARNPAAVLGNTEHGFIREGARAEFCVLRDDGTVEALSPDEHTGNTH